MGIRDTEIERIIKYAQGLGITVLFKPFESENCAADWNWEEKSITIYGKERLSKTTLLIYFLHELGHHLDWIYNDKIVHKNVAHAYMLMNTIPVKDIPKKYRKVIFEEEVAAINMMEVIYKELDLKFPIWKLKRDQALDKYHYEMLYLHARFPTQAEYLAEKKRVTELLRG